MASSTLAVRLATGAPMPPLGISHNAASALHKPTPMRHALPRRWLPALALAFALLACGKQAADAIPATPTGDALPPPAAASAQTQAAAIAAANDPSVPSSQPQPPRPMRGVFTLTPERETFQECGNATVWWVTGSDATLQPLRQRASASAQTTHRPAPSIYAELTGELLGTEGSAGFVNDYRNIVRLSAVTRTDASVPTGCVR